VVSPKDDPDEPLVAPSPRHRLSTIPIAQRGIERGRFEATIRWRHSQRVRTLRRFVKRSAQQRWSRSLLRLLFYELGVGDDFSEFVGPLENVPARRYPQAVAVALALRHSYRKDMLHNFIVQLHRRRREHSRVR
jgi:hypothetical protein